MVVERVRPTTFRLTLHAFELATLISAARTVVAGHEAGLTAEAEQQLRDVLASFDAQQAKLDARDGG